MYEILEITLKKCLDVSSEVEKSHKINMSSLQYMTTTGQPVNRLLKSELAAHSPVCFLCFGLLRQLPITVLENGL